ncbi:MAG: hypothetical protein WEF28_03675, partial [Acidimicrobiia bacterium]
LPPLATLPPLAEGVAPARQGRRRGWGVSTNDACAQLTRPLFQPERISPSYLRPPSGGRRNLPPASGRTAEREYLDTLLSLRLQLSLRLRREWRRPVRDGDEGGASPPTMLARS